MVMRQRWLPTLGWVFGSIPATALAGWTALLVVGASAGVAVLGAVQGILQATRCGPGGAGWLSGPGMDLGVGVVLAWALVQGGYGWYLRRCRRISRSLGLAVVELLPEAPALMVGLCRRQGVRATLRPLAFSVHVDTAWRSASTSPAAARAEFGRLYRWDYDRILADLRGQPVLLASSTFNRHDSAGALRAIAEGWGVQRPGPLLPAQPPCNSQARRGRDQLRMFGAVLSTRRVDRPAAWRCRLFDCLRAPGTPATLHR